MAHKRMLALSIEALHSNNTRDGSHRFHRVLPGGTVTKIDFALPIHDDDSRLGFGRVRGIDVGK